jgi:hypothetical protein
MITFKTITIKYIYNGIYIILFNKCYLFMKKGSLFCFVVMRSTKLGCFRLCFGKLSTRRGPWVQFHDVWTSDAKVFKY